MRSAANNVDCGSVGGIGGWIEKLNPGLDLYCLEDEELEALVDLFYPDSIPSFNWRKITNTDAVRAIDNWCDCGKPQWNKVRPDLALD